MHEKSGKASFGHIYDRRDPREYFKTLGSMDYKIPGPGQRLFSALVEQRRGANGDPVNVVDLLLLLRHQRRVAEVRCHAGRSLRTLLLGRTRSSLQQRAGGERRCILRRARERARATSHRRGRV